MFIPKESASIEIDWPVKASFSISVLSSIHPFSLLELYIKVGNHADIN
jgi:hypothetical protein